MFFFTKPKATLASLIPDGYIDIHSHLLPGIDDGAKNPDETLALVKTLQEYGFSQFVTTPHVLTGVWNNTPESINNAYHTASSYLTNNNIDLPFKAAAEYLMDDTFVKTFKSEPLLTLRDNYVLVEMSYLNAPINLYDIIYDLQIAGYKPVLAHPERYIFYHRRFEEYAKLKKAGCAFQINLLSVTGYYGKGIVDTAIKLLENNMIDFTGSDVHHEKHAASFKQNVLIKNTAPLLKALNNNAFFK